MQNTILFNIKTTIILIFIFSSFMALGQSEKWIKDFDQGASELFKDIIGTVDQGQLAIGYSGASAQDAKVFLSKSDLEGIQQWGLTYDSPIACENGCQGTGIIPISSGGYAIYGQSFEPHYKMFVMKIDDFGNEVWVADFQDSLAISNTSSIELDETVNGEFLLSRKLDMGGLDSIQDDSSKIIIRRLTSNGMISDTYETEIFNPLVDSSSPNLTPTLDDGFAIGIIKQPSPHPASGSVNIIKYDVSGNQEWLNNYNSTSGFIFIFGMDIHLNGDLIVYGYNHIVDTSSTERTYFILKTDSQGNEIFQNNFDSFNSYTVAVDVVITDNEDYYAIGVTDRPTPFDIWDSVWRLDAMGNVIWRTDLTGYDSSIKIGLTTDGGVVVPASHVNQDRDARIIKIDGTGLFAPKRIEGKVFDDQNTDCTDNSEPIIANQILKITDGVQDYYTVSDAMGYYEKYNLVEGTFSIEPIAINPYVDYCMNGNPVTFTGIDEDTSIVDVGVETLVECPYLSIDVHTNNLRNCFNSNGTVYYQNTGTATAIGAYFTLELETPLSLVSADLPYTYDSADNSYTFQLGDLVTGYSSSMDYVVQLPCDTSNVDEFTGHTYCINANIYPDTICNPISPNWDGSDIQVEAVCEGDSLRFYIRNIGFGDMINPRNYLVIEDEIMYFQDQYILDAGEELDFAVLASGATYRLEAEQDIDHPISSDPISVIERCGMEPFSLGFVNMFSMNDNNPFVDISCSVVTNAYDPNDKTGFPLGYGSENYIWPNKDIEYIIRFQNLGSADAVNVVVRDILPEELNLGSLKLGSSSHSYSLEIHDRMLKFTFNNINLPPESIDEEGSNGFIKFKIAQVTDLMPGTTIENDAKIYFDFNAPIITNKTLHTIAENVMTVSLSEEAIKDNISLKAYPNPFVDYIQFEIDRSFFDQLDFSLFDATGKQIAADSFIGNNFTFYRRDIASGIYFYRITSNGKLFASGQIVIK